jgi:hypothetical protein
VFTSIESLRIAKDLLGNISENKEGKTQAERTSALRYFFACLRMIKEKGDVRLEPENSGNREIFIDYVGEFVGLGAVSDGLYTNDFRHLAQDKGYAVSNNFLTVQLKNAESIEKDYPGRPAPILVLKKWGIRVHKNAINNLNVFFGFYKCRVAFVVWASRKFESNSSGIIEHLNLYVESHFPAEYVEFFRIKHGDIPGLSSSDELVSKLDIKSLFSDKVEDFDTSGICSVRYVRPHEMCSTVVSKPFLILSGPSGTGKSRWVRQQAYRTWNGTEKPIILPNFWLIPVKPNWHDASDLLGYVTRLGLRMAEQPRFVVTDFVRFLVDAWKNQNTAYWLCLDEMNLAPVEQYFAEYLSVIETRKVDGFSIITDALIPPSAFLDIDWSDFCKHVGLEITDSVAERIKSEGLSLPPNLIVVGTVNMDETTHSFSRKVLDRAFVWEMPIGDLDEGLDPDDLDPMKYPEVTPPVWVPLLATGGNEAGKKLREIGALPDAWLETTDTTKAVVSWLKRVNGVLEGTPFQVSYRVRDELLLLALARGVTTVEALQQALDDGLYSKILPRIEGDVVRTQKALAGLGSLLLDLAGLADTSEWKQIFPADPRQELDFQRLSKAPHGPAFMFGSETWPSDPFAPAMPWRRSLNKIRSMLLKLEGQFTSYWD